jgi:glutathione S-transferase
MITLYTFGPMFGLPDPSPFCMKAELLLKMSGLPYWLDHSGFAKAPKGKQPYIDDGGEKIADSAFIRWHLETRHGIDFDPGLAPGEKAVAWAFQKACEEHLYFGMVRDRWITGDNFDKGPRKYFDAAPALIRPLIAAKIRRDVRTTLHGQGFGRHTTQEAERITIHGIGQLAAFLDGKPFLMGEAPCGADATTFAWVTGMLCPLFAGPIQSAAAGHANLVAYRERGMAKWYPDFSVAT